MTVDKPMPHKRYIRWAIRRRQREAQEAAGIYRDPHGLYTFCCITVIVVSMAALAAMGWVATH